MLTRKKRLTISHSSPKTPLSKSCEHLPKESFLNELNYCSTPTRSSRGRISATTDDSPTLSQEPVNVTWKWGTDSPPIRNVCAKPKNVQTPTSHKLNKHKKSHNQPTNDTCETFSRNSPTGVYKFHQEFQKMESEPQYTQCDISLKDPVSPSPIDKTVTNRTSRLSRVIHSPSLSPITVHNEDIEMVGNNAVGDGPSKTHLTNELNWSTLKSIKDDLLNDSDFDQILLTCSEKVEATIQKEKIDNRNNAESSKVKETEIPTKKLAINTELSFFQNDESIDDILGAIDDSILNNSKLMRHKSMPHQSPSNNNIKRNGVTDEKLNRKSFSRHESMPVNQGKRLVQRQMGQGLGGSSESMSRSSSTSTITSKCSSEEIAEKRRIAIERLKNKNKNRK